MWSSLTSRERFAEHSKDTFDAVLDLSADLAHKHFATAQQEGRRERADHVARTAPSR